MMTINNNVFCSFFLCFIFNIEFMIIPILFHLEHNLLKMHVEGIPLYTIWSVIWRGFFLCSIENIDFRGLQFVFHLEHNIFKTDSEHNVENISPLFLLEHSILKTGSSFILYYLHSLCFFLSTVLHEFNMNSQET